MSALSEQDAAALARGRWLATYGYAFYTSAITLAATGDTGIIATPLVTSGATAIFAANGELIGIGEGDQAARLLRPSKILALPTTPR